MLLQRGCRFSEFGTRRRRDYRTQHLVLRGLCRAARDAAELGWRGQLLGTSNVHFAMQNGIAPVGTVAHEWIMGVAAITDDYEHANEIALRYWICSFGKGVNQRRISISGAIIDAGIGAWDRLDGHFWYPSFP